MEEVQNDILHHSIKLISIVKGAFLIPYCLNIILTGIPLFFFELSFGQFASQSPIAIWSVVPLFQGEIASKRAPPLALLYPHQLF